jgi:hypothetical protein
MNILDKVLLRLPSIACGSFLSAGSCLRLIVMFCTGLRR